MFKHVYFGLALGSTLLGAVGLVQLKNTKGIEQIVSGIVGIGGTAVALTTLGLGIAYKGKEDSLERDFKDSLEKSNQVKDRELAGLKLEINELKSRIKVLEFDKETNLKQISELQEKLNIKAEEYLRIVSEKDIKIKTLEDRLNTRDTRIEDFLEDCRKHTVTFFSLRYNNLDAIQKALEKADVSDEIRISFDKRLRDIYELKQDLTQAMVEIKKLNLTDFKEILDYIFEFDNKFLNVKTRWKDAQVKDYKSEAKSLKTSLNASIPKEDARARIRGAMDEVDERITEKYEALLLNNNSIHSQLLDLLEQRNLVIDDLTKQNEELSKPLLATGKSDYAQIANRIAMYYYENYGYKLDVIQWEENETGYSVLYATRRNPGLTETELLPHNTREQLAAFTNSLQGTLPKFTFNYQHSTVTLEVTLRKPVKKDTSKNDIDKIWIPVEKFESFVRTWERIRITGGSQAGKSPSAKNIALAIMKQRKDKGVINLYDPQGKNSKKDFWNIPKVGLTHDDSIKGLKIVCDSLKELAETGNTKLFNLNIFDEIDSTIAEGREGSESYYFFKDKLTYALKQGSHQGVGCIIIGQSVDANVIPGMTWSDWNNVVQVHIGSNAGLWLEKSTTVTSEQSTKLLEQYHKIQSYCDRKNEELGLDIFTDTTAYRFALTVGLNGVPKFIQLPDFDSYEYDEVMNSDDHQELISSVLNEVQEKIQISDELPSVKSVVSCPQCDSTSVVKKGKSNTGKQQYACKDCGKKFTNDIS